LTSRLRATAMIVWPPRGSARPRVAVRPATGTTRAVVLVLYGGQVASRRRSRRWHLSAVRMVAFARALHRTAATDGVEVWTLRYRFRGWNGADRSPVVDARWALEEVRRRHGDVPVALVGHSMGGRVAVAAADDPSVRAVVALAPWLPRDEPAQAAAGCRVLVLHGTRDRRTDPRGSLDFATRARTLAAEMVLIEIAGAGHAMLRRTGVWSGLTTYFTRSRLVAAVTGAPVDLSWPAPVPNPVDPVASLRLRV
jgi:dienelactone hydrolase